MITLRTATLSLVLGVGLLLSGCSAQRTGPDVGEQPSRTSANVLTRQQIEQYPSVSTVEDLLVQLMPGIEDAGSGIRIRGLSGSPLVVIDGIPLQVGAQIPVTPRDVARIEVLRSGGATAAYGFRGSGGVIVIQTR